MTACALLALGGCEVPDDETGSGDRTGRKSGPKSDAEFVCSRLTTGNLAKADDRVEYLRKLIPRAEKAGLGFAPNLRLAIRATERGQHSETADALGRLQSTCDDL